MLLLNQQNPRSVQTGANQHQKLQAYRRDNPEHFDPSSEFNSVIDLRMGFNFGYHRNIV